MWSKKDRSFIETAIYSFLNNNKYKKNIYELARWYAWLDANGKDNRRIHTIRYYLMLKDEKKARENIRKYMEQIEDRTNISL